MGKRKYEDDPDYDPEEGKCQKRAKKTGQTVARTSPRTRRASPRIRDVRAVHKDVPEAVPVPAAELREPPAAPVEDNDEPMPKYMFGFEEVLAAAEGTTVDEETRAYMQSRQEQAMPLRRSGRQIQRRMHKHWQQRHYPNSNDNYTNNQMNRCLSRVGSKKH